MANSSLDSFGQEKGGKVFLPFCTVYVCLRNNNCEFVLFITDVGLVAKKVSLFANRRANERTRERDVVVGFSTRASRASKTPLDRSVVLAIIS